MENLDPRSLVAISVLLVGTYLSGCALLWALWKGDMISLESHWGGFGGGLGGWRISTGLCLLILFLVFGCMTTAFIVDSFSTSSGSQLTVDSRTETPAACSTVPPAETPAESPMTPLTEPSIEK